MCILIQQPINYLLKHSVFYSSSYLFDQFLLPQNVISTVIATQYLNESILRYWILLLTPCVLQRKNRIPLYNLVCECACPKEEYSPTTDGYVLIIIHTYRKYYLCTLQSVHKMHWKWISQSVVILVILHILDNMMKRYKYTKRSLKSWYNEYIFSYCVYQRFSTC